MSLWFSLLSLTGNTPARNLELQIRKRAVIIWCERQLFLKGKTWKDFFFFFFFLLSFHPLHKEKISNEGRNEADLSDIVQFDFC